MNVEPPAIELNEGLSNSMGSMMMRLEYTEAAVLPEKMPETVVIEEFAQVAIQMTGWQRLWQVLNMDVRDVWKAIKAYVHG